MLFGLTAHQAQKVAFLNSNKSQFSEKKVWWLLKLRISGGGLSKLGSETELSSLLRLLAFSASSVLSQLCSHCVSSNLSRSVPIRKQNSLTSSLTSRWNPKEWISSPMGPVRTVLELSEDLALTLPLPEFLVKVLITLPFLPICWIGSFLQNAVLSTRLVPSFRANLIFSSSFRSLLKCYFISLILEHTL